MIASFKSLIKASENFGNGLVIGMGGRLIR